MTRDEFHTKYRPRLLGYFSECYAGRKLSPSDVGMEIDRMYSGLNALLAAMLVDAIKVVQAEAPAQKEPVKINGHTPAKETKAPVGRTA